MSSTTEATVIRPADLASEMRRLSQLVGGKYPHVYLAISDGYNPHITVRHDLSAPGNTGNVCDVTGDTFAEMIANAEAGIEIWKKTRHNAVIRSMALAIIELTDEHGKCTNLLLRNRKFTDADIAEFGDAACRRAAEMAGNAPFSIEAEGV